MKRDLAAEFAALGGRVWLNCAHQGPLPACARVAAEEAVRWKAEPWELTTERFSGVPLRLKRALGRLIGAPAEEIILANSASYGLHLIANGFPFAAGDEVLVMRGDFPSDILPWLGLEPRGVVTLQLTPRSGRVLQVEDVRAAIGPRTRLLCLTWVHSLSGWTIDMDAIGRLCREHGIAFILNVSQALGARALDVASAPVDAIVCAGWKWLLGPYATGFCWVRPDLLRRLTCQQTYWLTMLNADDLGREQLDLTLRNDAGAARWDVFATANFINFSSFSASVEFLLEYGVASAAAHDAALVQRLIDGLDRRHYQLTSPESEPARSTLVFVEPRDRERVAQMQRTLVGQGVHVAYRAGALRMSPHFYNDITDIDRALSALDAVA